MRNAIIQLPNGGCAQAIQPFGAGKLGMTIDGHVDCTGIGRNVLRIGRKTIIRVDVICVLMEIHLLDCDQVQQVT